MAEQGDLPAPEDLDIWAVCGDPVYSSSGCLRRTDRAPGTTLAAGNRATSRRRDIRLDTEMRHSSQSRG